MQKVNKEMLSVELHIVQTEFFQEDVKKVVKFIT